jgi:RNA-directed DNA polymerase
VFSFDSIGHAVLKAAIQRRVNDGSVLRLVGKWLKAGIVDGEELRVNEHGTPQGGVMSPRTQKVTFSLNA